MPPGELFGYFVRGAASIMRQIRPVVFFLALALCGGLAAGMIGHAVAQAPGSGHGYLIDKHVGAGLDCAACHAESPPAKAPDNATCSKCHGGYSDIAAKTASDTPNPHASHLGEIPCTSCHHVHQASTTYCTQCHAFDMNTP